ncbi:hypothetical protein [Klebsiella phage Kp2]|uniref:Uncharacterized protein n=1 Tax=Klebsiella phage Kp2 TaxID=1701805 RepID=A0A0P0I3Q2_9CAUD|nr:hypothetical protein AU150_gp01 [Klebsiella phage Kp2]ALJ98098.1 hypothetical protein [Klebsiella phage Kp2]DAW25772.1 MAG TPA: hypothetical protein [Caudoviricetes sp.]
MPCMTDRREGSINYATLRSFTYVTSLRYALCSTMQYG